MTLIITRAVIIYIYIYSQLYLFEGMCYNFVYYTPLTLAYTLKQDARINYGNSSSCAQKLNLYKPQRRFNDWRIKHWQEEGDGESESAGENGNKMMT